MFSQMFGTFQIKNVELGSLADFCYEVCHNTAKEQSAGMTMGLDGHAHKRQDQYLENVKSRLEAIRNHPAPDLPAVHPILFEKTYEEPEIITNDAGEVVNTDAKAVAIMWHTICYELVKSNSAGLGGGMTSFDADRCQQNIESIEQFLTGVYEAAEVDLPETAHPEATPAKKTRSR